MSDELINVPSLLWSDYCQMFIDIENRVWHRIVLSNRTKSNSGALGWFQTHRCARHWFRKVHIFPDWCKVKSISFLVNITTVSIYISIKHSIKFLPWTRVQWKICRLSKCSSSKGEKWQKPFGRTWVRSSPESFSLLCPFPRWEEFHTKKKLYFWKSSSVGSPWQSI